ncbi:MAG: hypothetical protein K0S44_1372 [Bacteroidetes bacterium]|nr:hypothetical protein [Bacteroidota bacterium]
MRKKLLLLASFLFLTFHIFSGTCTSGNGTYPNWASAGWTCTTAPFGGPPGCNTTIVVNGTINMSNDVDYSGCPSPMILTINGTLNFTTNGVQFKLPTGSTVEINTGGTIIKTFPGGGSSTLISIGGSNVWTAGDGNVSGPLTYGAPLPIELISFAAVVCDRDICLDWITASETNNDYFTVERSSDGMNFESLSQLDGAGNSTATLTYSFIDHSPLSGTGYYRLKQTDFDGRSTYSSIKPVDFAADQEFSFVVYPNPNTGSDISLEVNAPLDQEILVVVKDISGKENYSKVVILKNENDNVIVIDPSKKLSAGIYFITATSQQSIYNKKMIVN